MKLGRVYQFFFEVKSEPNTAPLQSTAMIVAFYVIALASLFAVPINFIGDLPTGNLYTLVSEVLYLALIVTGIVLFWTTRVLRMTKIAFVFAFLLICVNIVVDGGGVRGMGAFYIVSGYSVLYFAVGLRGGILIPLVVLIGTYVRTYFGNFYPNSIFNDPDMVPRFLTILTVSSVLGIAAVVYQHFLFKNLSQVAYIDPISQLANRTKLEEFLRQSVKQSRAHHKPFSVYAVKIQHFSQVNSTQGSSRADSILRQVGDRLKPFLSKGSLVGRYSGTVFLFATPRFDKDELKSFGELLFDAVSQPYLVDDQTVTISVAVAVSRFPDDAETEEQLIGNLQTTLNHSSEVHDNVKFFDQSQAKVDKLRFDLGEELRHAIERNEFFVVYHPKIDLSTGNCHGAEVLLRWKSQKYGMVGPDQFIPLAEELGLIRSITRWVLSQSLKELSDFDGESIHAINVSPIDLEDHSFLDHLDREVASYRIDPSRIELEITEGVLMNHDSSIQQVLETLRNRGYRLAIDDFGTGYSSLNYLTKLRVNNLKIDQSFIRTLADPAQSGTTAGHRIVEAVISMARSLNLEMTAEGVETEAQARYLTSLGCTYAQGWLYAKPMPIDDYRRWIETRARRTVETRA